MALSALKPKLKSCSLLKEPLRFSTRNLVVYHDAADTNPQIDVSVLWTTVDKVLKLQRQVLNHELVARFHSWRTKLINACAQAFVTPSTACVFRLVKPFHNRPRHKLINTCRLFSTRHTQLKLWTRRKRWKELTLPAARPFDLEERCKGRPAAVMALWQLPSVTRWRMVRDLPQYEQHTETSRRIQQPDH